MSIPTTDTLSSTPVMRSASSITWSRQFTFRGKQLFYNRIPFNNWSERAVEVPLAVAFERRWHNPRQIWVEAEAKELEHVRYNRWRGGARAIVVIELTKLPQPFALHLNVPPSPLPYKRLVVSKSLSFIAELLHM